MVRVNERMLLIDAVKDLLNHVCSAAEKTVINDAVSYFTTGSRQLREQAVVMATTAGDKCSADDRMVQDVAKKTLTTDTCSSHQNISNEDCPSEASCRDEEVDVKDVEVAAAGDDDRSVETIKAHGCWKLLIRVHDRRKNMQCRYVHCAVLSHLTRCVNDQQNMRWVVS